jgi:hypothetical protein
MFCNCFYCNLIKSKKVIFKVSGAGAAAGAEIRICVSVETEPNKYFWLRSTGQ